MTPKCPKFFDAKIALCLPSGNGVVVGVGVVVAGGGVNVSLKKYV